MRNGAILLGTAASVGIIGAGGWATGLMFCLTGQALQRCDTYGAWFAPVAASKWQQELIPGATIAVADVDVLYTSDGSPPDPGSETGSYAAAIAWSNFDVRAIATSGRVLIKKPGATLFTRTAMPQRLGMAPNQGSRMCGNPLEFDPANPSVFLFGAPLHGIHIFTAHGDAFTVVPTSTLPLPTAGTRYIIRYDRSSAVVGSGAAARTQRISIGIPGSGVYKTEDAGATWAKIADRPTNPTNFGHMKYDHSNGHLWVSGTVNELEGVASRWNGAGWIETPFTCKTIAISPHNAGHVYAVGQGGSLRVSTNYGGAWSADPTGYGAMQVDINWHTKAELYKSVGEAEFSPIENTLWFSAGIGCWKVPNPPTVISYDTLPPIQGFSKGIENMVAGNLAQGPDGSIAVTMHDRGCMVYPPGEAGKKFASNYGIANGRLIHGMGVDFHPTDGAFCIAGGFFQTSDMMGWTNDRGGAWHEVNNLIALSTGRGGAQVVCLGYDEWIVGQLTALPFGAASRPKNALYLTMNGRAAIPTWAEVQIGNGNAVDVSRTFNTIRRTIVKDRFSTGNIRRVLFYNPGDVDNPGSADTLSCRGVWEILVNMTTGATTRNRLFDGTLFVSNQGSYGVKLQQNGPGDWTLCGGDNAMGLFRSVDDGLNWAKITGTDDQAAGNRFTEVHACCAGKAFPGSAFKTHYAIGYRLDADVQHTNDHSKYGVWSSIDNCVTWKREQNFPANIYDLVTDMIADQDRWGILTVSFGGGSGTHQIDLNGAGFGIKP